MIEVQKYNLLSKALETIRKCPQPNSQRRREVRESTYLDRYPFQAIIILIFTFFSLLMTSASTHQKVPAVWIAGVISAFWGWGNELYVQAFLER